MHALRLKIFNRDPSDWRYQVMDGRGEVIAERRFLPDRASAERLGLQERVRIAASLARNASLARRRGPRSALPPEAPAGNSVRGRAWFGVFRRTPRLKPWKHLDTGRTIRPLRAR